MTRLSFWTRFKSTSPFFIVSCRKHKHLVWSLDNLRSSSNSSSSSSWILHWLRVAERITFRLAVLTYRCLHGSAPEFLTSLLQCVSGIHTRQRLRSASSSDLMVPRTIRSTIGERSFQSAAASTWYPLSHSVRSSTSVLQFRSRLETICAFIPAILLNLSLRLWLNIFVPWSLDLRHVNDDSNTN